MARWTDPLTQETTSTAGGQGQGSRVTIGVRVAVKESSIRDTGRDGLEVKHTNVQGLRVQIAFQGKFAMIFVVWYTRNEVAVNGNNKE